MAQVEGFVEAGRLARKAFASAPQADFNFGPFQAHSEIITRSRVPRRGVPGRTCRLTVINPDTDSGVVCELERVGMPLMSELTHGISGMVDEEPLVVRRTGGPRFRRKDRLVQVSGAVSLTVGYEDGFSVIRSSVEPQRVLWTSANGGMLSQETSHREAAVICLLVVNAVDQSSSLLRYLSFV